MPQVFTLLGGPIMQDLLTRPENRVRQWSERREASRGAGRFDLLDRTVPPTDRRGIRATERAFEFRRGITNRGRGRRLGTVKLEGVPLPTLN
jgi:hypothetical protein